MKDVLELIWEFVTFEEFRKTGDWMVFVITICVLVLVGAVILIVGSVICYILWTIYRLIAYDYEMATYRAKVRKKTYEEEYTSFASTGKVCVPIHHPAEYNVHIVTENGLEDVIDDEELYNDVKKGSKIQVQMKIGRSRGRDREIKYWRIVTYSW